MISVTEMGRRKNKIRIGILFGGKSGEHEVSISSASSVIAALNPDEYRIAAIAIRRNGRLATAAEVRRMLGPELSGRVEVCGGADGLAALIAGFCRGAGSGRRAPDVIFPLLHGPYGEDGTIQGLLEMAGISYVGCGVLASAVGMDKVIMKRLFEHASLPIVPYHVEQTRGLKGRIRSVREKVEDVFDYPFFSKPANLGSSVGVHKIHRAGEFGRAVMSSARFDRKIIIEKGINARELECAVLGNDDAEASIVGEIIPGGEFYDYEAKYRNPKSRVEIPARISRTQCDEIRELALRAYKAIDGSGLARVDFFLDRRSGKIWLNEINTMPGFTPISMYPKLWDACGVPFEALVRRLIDLGLDRQRERAAHAAEPAVADQIDKK
jgi:D-alanine-D-alanine ligase